MDKKPTLNGFPLKLILVLFVAFFIFSSGNGIVSMTGSWSIIIFCCLLFCFLFFFFNNKIRNKENFTPEKKESVSRSFLRIIPDFLIVVASYIILIISSLKYMCSGPFRDLLGIQYLYFTAILFVCVHIIFFRSNKDSDKKFIMYARLFYLLVWLIYFVQIILVPAAPVGSC